jgi:hypothetical protein
MLSQSQKQEICSVRSTNLNVHPVQKKAACYSPHKIQEYKCHDRASAHDLQAISSKLTKSITTHSATSNSWPVSTKRNDYLLILTVYPNTAVETSQILIWRSFLSSKKLRSVCCFHSLFLLCCSRWLLPSIFTKSDATGSGWGSPSKWCFFSWFRAVIRD